MTEPRELNRPRWAVADGAPPTVRVRASSWGELFDCAYRWEGKNLLGMNSPSGMPAHLGSAIHAGTAAFDGKRMTAGQREPVNGDDVIDAVDTFCEALDAPGYEVDFSRDTMSIREARKVGSTLVSRYCMDVAPQFEFVAVEARMQPVRIDVGSGVVIELTGSMDRARVAAGAKGVVIPDIKTGRSVVNATTGAVSTKGRSAQLGVYQLMWEHAYPAIPTEGGQIIALPTAGNLRPAVSKAWDAKPVLLGTDTAPGLLEVAGAMFSSGLFPPNPTSPMCGERYCPRHATCHYREP